MPKHAMMYLSNNKGPEGRVKEKGGIQLKDILMGLPGRAVIVKECACQQILNKLLFQDSND